MGQRLDERFRRAARVNPAARAVQGADDTAPVSYRQLVRTSEVIAEHLARAGVTEGDRVGVCAPKSVGGVAALIGILRLGAAYVPADPAAPPNRNSYIFDDCGVRAALCAPGLAEGLIENSDRALAIESEISFDADVGGKLALLRAHARSPTARSPANLAYVLYTSGSTGKPKGVMHTHGSALAFVDWCIDTFQARQSDRFASHAPFHFDLSIHDLWVPLTTGASVLLIGESAGKQPLSLAEHVADHDISVWYSTPSTLRLMVEFGSMDPERYSSLRIVHFAGEVFPVKHLRALKEVWPSPRYFNLYGPTETNVCTYHEIPAVVPPDRTAPYPIGSPCSGDRCRVVDERADDVDRDTSGELLVSGPSLMAGYWNLPERNEEAFLLDRDGTRWYRTGDVVRDLGDQCYDFLGRRDRMVKRRGYRVELGEIEAALYRHPSVSEAAAVALPDEQAGLLIQAFVTWAGPDQPSLVRMKQFCAGELPLYMIPDRFTFPDRLPKTSTGKIDYQTLKDWVP